MCIQGPPMHPRMLPYINFLNAEPDAHPGLERRTAPIGDFYELPHIIQVFKDNTWSAEHTSLNNKNNF